MSRAAAIWRGLGRAELTFYLLLALVGDLYAGYFVFRADPQLFGPLNRLDLLEWIATYGIHHLGATWWFFAFLGLMALLVLNTTACTLGRLGALIRLGRGGGDRLDHWLRFAPHLMHVAFVVILVSHLVSYLVGVNDQNNILRPGGSLTLPGSVIRLRLDGIENEFYQGEHLAFYQGRPLAQHIKLTFLSPDGRDTRTDLGLNRPVWCAGYSLHVKRYAPDQDKDGMGRAPYVNLVIRKDPGIRLFVAGTVLFVLGLLAYLWQASRARPRGASLESTS